MLAMDSDLFDLLFLFRLQRFLYFCGLLCVNLLEFDGCRLERHLLIDSNCGRAFCVRYLADGIRQRYAVHRHFGLIHSRV